MPFGTLFLIPNTLGPTLPEHLDPLASLIPNGVQHLASQLSYFIAEDAKTARAFLKIVALKHPLARPLQEIRIEELNINTETSFLPTMLEPIKAGLDAGLISEAGVPAVADPGANLVRLAHEEGILVHPLVGPSSLLLAIMASGLNGQSFAFHGYLPMEAAQRLKRIKFLEERSRAERQTQLFIETPYRNGAMLDALTLACAPNTLICIATDLTLSTEKVSTKRSTSWKRDLKNGKGPDFHKKPTVFLLLAG